jgi:hypothetical protein
MTTENKADQEATTVSGHLKRGVSWQTSGWPPEKKTVLVWLKGSALPFCGYMKYAAGDKESPYFVVYHGNPEIGADVKAWCDCLPNDGPQNVGSQMYESRQAN